jgi:hypothetical protein
VQKYLPKHKTSGQLEKLQIFLDSQGEKHGEGWLDTYCGVGMVNFRAALVKFLILKVLLINLC